MNNIKLGEEQQLALNTMMSGKNVFLTGKAGTGKTLIIDTFSNQYQGHLMILAPTGFAARNLANASTIHSSFALDLGYFQPHWSPDFKLKQEELCQWVDTILIDEISMVSASVFSAIDIQLRFYMKTNLPFGGKQIIVVGDFFQLPPVIDEELSPIFLDDYNGVYAFNTNSWRQAEFTNIFLQEVHRQKNSEEVAFLDALRNHTPDVEQYLSICNRQVFNNPDLLIPFSRQFCICCTNKSAKEINRRAMEHLFDKGFISAGVTHGHFLYNDLPTDKFLSIKKGARVMMLTNHRQKVSENTTKLIYANGDIGEVVGYDIEVNIVYILLANGVIVSVGKVEFPNYSYEIERDAQGKAVSVNLEEVGWFYQFPISPAYATTIHKAQGRTLDNVHLVLGDGCFAYGQLYTAISRVRSLKNLTLDRPINIIEAMNDPQVIDFYHKTFNMQPLGE